MAEDLKSLLATLTEDERNELAEAKKQEQVNATDAILETLSSLKTQHEQLNYYHKEILPMLAKLKRAEQAMAVKRVAKIMDISTKVIYSDLKDEYEGGNIYTVDDPLLIDDKTETQTDLGNALRFSRLCKHKVIYCAEFGSWLIWDGRRWAIDKTGKIMEFAQKTIRSLYKDIGNMDSRDERDTWLEHAKNSESYPRMKAMLKLSEHMLAVTVSQLDANPWLLNVANGIVDLKSGELLPHDQTKLITKLVPVKYTFDNDCPVFDKFLGDIFPLPDGRPNDDLIGFMQRFIGYCLTGDTSEQKMAIAWGSGANGKGTLLNLISDVLGDYAQQAQAESFMAKQNDNSVSNDIAMLRGARYVLASESKEGRKLNEPLIKQVTGQDKVTARFLYKDFFTYQPAFKLLLLTNYKPAARGDDAALWRRILLIPFTQKFEGDKADKELNDKLRTQDELEGVLRWAIAGCIMWQREGLKPPREVIQATNEYRNENDVIENWKEERCVTGNYITEKIGTLYNDFMKWAAENGEKVYISNKKFSQNLQQKGFELFQGGRGVRKIKGLGLLEQGQESLDIVDFGEVIEDKLI